MTEQHVPVERLAAYAAGDLDASAALEVEAHVLLCADCRADTEALQRVAADLGAVGQVAMPATVAERVEAALAAEADAAEDRAAAAPVGDLLPLTRRRRPSLAGIAAIAAGVALFAAISVPFVTRDPADPASEAGGRQASEAAGTRRIESGLDYSAGDPAGALGRALSGATADRAAPAAVASPTGSALTTTESDTKGGGFAPGRDDLAVREYAMLQSDAARLASCVGALAASQPEVGRTPLLVDFGTFEGRPAMIVVFPTVTRGEIRPDRVDFWAVGPRCGITPGDDDVLHFARFAPPPGLT